MDWEKDCKKCGGCCTACFKHNNEIIRPINLICKYINDDNTCPIYNNRREIAGCFTAQEIGNSRPQNCVFGGNARMVNNKEFLNNLPDGKAGLSLAGIFKWRD